MTLDITVERAQLRLDIDQPDRQTSYVKLRAAGRQCNTVICHGPNPVWTKQTFRSSPEDKFLFEVCFPAGPIPQPYSDRVFGRGVFDFKLFAMKNSIEDMDDTSEMEVNIPLESVEVQGRDVGVLTLRVKYIIGKMHIGGLNHFSQRDLTFNEMGSRINQSNINQSSSNIRGPVNQGFQTPQSQIQRNTPSIKGSNVSPSNITPFNVGNSQIQSQIFPYQSSQGPQGAQQYQYPPSSISPQQPQIIMTTTQVTNKTHIQPNHSSQYNPNQNGGGSLANMRQPWLLIKSGAQKLNIFSILDSGGKPFELAPGKIHSQFTKSRMRN